MIKPYKKDQALLADILAFDHPTGFKVWWLGQSGFLIKWQKKLLLFDPYLSDSLTVKYLTTDKPHTRMSELVISPSDLPPIDFVTSSHNHTDHLDAETLLPIFQKNPDTKFIISEANRVFVADRLKCALDFPVGLKTSPPTPLLSGEGSKFVSSLSPSPVRRGGWGERLNFSITAIPSAHNKLEFDEQNHSKFIGFVVQFGGFSVYHSGDTLWYDGLDEILKPYNLDIAFLPINGNKPERKVAGNMSADEAAHFGKTVGAKLVIPHHYDMFEFNTEDPQNFVLACQKYETPHRVLALGEGLEYAGT